MGNDNPNSLFILGAGFTKAANPKAPLNSELLEAINKADPGTLAKYSSIFNSTDIERVLTLIDIALGANPNMDLKKDREAIELQIANFFKLCRFDRNNPPKWVERFARDVLQPNDTIVSLNYDCYLEGALDNYGVWSPNGGYPKGHPLAEGIATNPYNIRVFKIHGSENFRESVVIGNNKTDIGYIIEESIYPKSGERQNIGGGGFESWPYIIAPSFVKIPHVQIAYMMLCLLDIAKEAKNLIIIGCGMRQEDNFLWLILTRFLYEYPNGISKKLIIVDPGADNLWRRIDHYCAGNIEERVSVVPICFPLEKGIGDLIATFK
ncbi:MAG: hypothetical protein PHR28_01440 [candidate division Zixibacteria bacterium]|nr:hypothetical protein [candidate division Zixibacteria bacterium]